MTWKYIIFSVRHYGLFLIDIKTLAEVANKVKKTDIGKQRVVI